MKMNLSLNELSLLGIEMRKIIKYTLIYAGLFYLILITTALISAHLFLSPSLNPIRERIREEMSRKVSEILRSSFPWLRIYGNNLMWALPMTLPYIGIFAFFFITMNTGIVLGALLSYTTSLSQKLSHILPLFLPHGILESLAYGLALYASVNGKRLSYSLKIMIYVAFILLIAAGVEYLEIMLWS